MKSVLLLLSSILWFITLLDCKAQLQFSFVNDTAVITEEQPYVDVMITNEYTYPVLFISRGGINFGFNFPDDKYIHQAMNVCGTSMGARFRNRELTRSEQVDYLMSGCDTATFPILIPGDTIYEQFYFSTYYGFEYDSLYAVQLEIYVGDKNKQLCPFYWTGQLKTPLHYIKWKCKKGCGFEEPDYIPMPWHRREE